VTNEKEDTQEDKRKEQKKPGPEVWKKQWGATPNWNKTLDSPKKDRLRAKIGKDNKEGKVVSDV